MNIIRDREFTDEDVILDYNRYIDCEFNGCVLIYHGVGQTDISDSQLENCSWRFKGPADNTIGFLSWMSQNPAFRPALIELVQVGIFDNQVPLTMGHIGEEPHLVFNLGQMSEELARQFEEEQGELEEDEVDEE